MVTELSMIKPIMEHVKIEDLQAQLPAYLSAAAQAPTQSMGDVEAYTHSVLNFWKSTSVSSMPAWREAARIVFAMSPNSASCERVFAMLSTLFGDEQLSSLSDMLQAALLLRCNRNKRLQE